MPDALAEWDGSDVRIRVMNANGTGDHTILANMRFSVESRWPTGNKIVFMSLMDADAG
jgi:hypothetical protein